MLAPKSAFAKTVVMLVLRLRVAIQVFLCCFLIQLKFYLFLALAV